MKNKNRIIIPLMIFTVPNKFRGRKLTDLVGNYGHGGGYHFGITTERFVGDGGYLFSSDNMVTDEEISCADTYPEYRFTINLGKNISKVSLADFHNHWFIETVPKEEWRGEPIECKVIARVSYYFNVDPENETFYSDDGVAYYRDTYEPVEELLN